MLPPNKASTMTTDQNWTSLADKITAEADKLPLSEKRADELVNAESIRNAARMSVSLQSNKPKP